MSINDRLVVREMRLEEVDFVIDYFHRASPEQLETLGVDPTRLPAPALWKRGYVDDYARPIEVRHSFLVIWLLDAAAIGFSTADRIAYGSQAHMHLHVVSPDHRRRGTGTEAVRRSVQIYFDALRIDKLYCEPNAFNVAPNRTLQKAGFRYLKTHMTVPGPLNFHQAVSQWVIEKPGRGA